MHKLYSLILLPLAIFANPSWFYNINPSNPNEIIGYGVSDTLILAKQNAIAEIVKTISVEVDARTDILKNNQDGKYSKNTSSNLQTRSKATLSGVKVLKVEEIDGKWYVASSYDNAPIEIKLKKLLPVNLSNESQNNYLSKTELFKKLNKEIKYPLNYEIIRKDNLWQIKYKDIILPLSQSDFYKLFTNTYTKTISIKSNKQKYEQNDAMYFKLNLNKRGYISILYVEHNGKVGVLTSNKLADKNFTYPDLKSEDTFTIANPYGKTIQELYVAIYSKQMLDLNRFENVADEYLDETNYNFHRLIDLFSKVEYATTVIKITK